MSTVERIHAQILHRRKDGIEEQIDLALQDLDAVTVLNTVLLPAMKDVGDRFGSGELILPFVLQSAEVMKRAVAHLEQYLEKREGYTKGKVVLATVYGDVHDIGKNLVNTILSNNGYTVFDLGKQVPLNTIIDKAQEVDADAIGLSALLVSTSKQMPACVKELDERGLSYPLIIGGAAINRGFGRRILYLDQERAYEPGVFYCKDAFEGLETVDQLLDPERHDALLSKRPRRGARASACASSEKLERRNAAAAGAGGRSRAQRGAARMRRSPQSRSGVRACCATFPSGTCTRFIDRNSLYKMSWQFRGVRDPAQVGGAAAHRARAAPAAFDGGSRSRRLAAARGGVRILAGARRRQHGGRLRPRRTSTPSWDASRSRASTSSTVSASRTTSAPPRMPPTVSATSSRSRS